MYSQVTISSKLLKIKDDENSKERIIDNVKNGDHNLGLKDLFRNSEVRKITIVMFVNWIVCSLGYYGISLGAANLGGDVFLSNILLALIEIPSYIYCALVSDYWGRKTVFIRYNNSL